MAWPLGVCSWSLQPDSPARLAEALQELNLSRVQLALDPIRTGAWDQAQTVAALHDAGVTIASGMMMMAGEDYTTLDTIAETGGVRPDATWSDNLAAAHANAEIAQRLRLPLVTFHAGFFPEGADDPERAKIIERTSAIAKAFTSRGVRVALETGQETAASLLQVLDALDEQVAVNFDPANMILYGKGDPIEAVRALAPHIQQVHIKDATPTTNPGTWGTETPAGQGAVDWAAFFAELHAARFTGGLMIEREGGDSRLADIRQAAQLVSQMTAARGMLG